MLPSTSKRCGTCHGLLPEHRSSCNDSARRRPPIDTAATSDECANRGSPKVFLAGNARAARCVKCGLVAWHYPVPLVITGPDLFSAIKFFAELADELREIRDCAINNDKGVPPVPGQPAWLELYAMRVAELAHDIGELHIPAEDT